MSFNVYNNLVSVLDAALKAVFIPHCSFPRLKSTSRKKSFGLSICHLSINSSSAQWREGRNLKLNAPHHNINCSLFCITVSMSIYVSRVLLNSNHLDESNLSLPESEVDLNIHSCCNPSHLISFSQAGRKASSRQKPLKGKCN